jgi:hypothetical protein
VDVEEFAGVHEFVEVGATNSDELAGLVDAEKQGESDGTVIDRHAGDLLPGGGEWGNGRSCFHRIAGGTQRLSGRGSGQAEAFGGPVERQAGDGNLVGNGGVERVEPTRTDGID